MQLKICEWHKCRQPFSPSNNRQTFCCPACKKARQNWKQMRGAALVDLLIANDGPALVAERRKLLEEINAAR